MNIDQSIQTAVLHQQSGRFAEAEAIYRKILEQSPDQLDALVLLGILCSVTDRRQAGIELFHRAIQLRPDDVRIHYNLANALCVDGRFSQAIPVFDRAIQLKPDFVDAHINRGNALKELGQIDPAVDAFRQAVRFDPKSAYAHNNLGMTLVERDELDPGIATLRQAVAIDPNNAAIHSNLLLTLHYDPALRPQALFDQHLNWDRRHAQPLRKSIPAHANDRNPDRPLRIGYMSPDFRRHSISYFLESLLASHDPQLFQIYCYSNVAHPDATTARLRRLVSNWREIRPMNDQQIAQLIRQDRIDILVDLSGHTGGNRLLVLARKPAPVQITYLGYPNTTGLWSIDYRLTDGHADPPGQTESLHSEQIIRLPRSFLCYRPPENAPPFNVRAGPVVFGSFNAMPKINAPLVKTWSQILRSNPESRILLKNTGLGSPTARQILLDRFAAEGIPAERVELLGPCPDELSHLQMYNHIDVALDSFPYHGTTTTCEALWMGVPTITLAGRAHLSRVGVSILNNAGLPDLIADDPRQYIEIATNLARDESRRKELRSTLRSRLSSSPLLDARGFTKEIEAAYRKMWRTWCQSPTKD